MAYIYGIGKILCEKLSERELLTRHSRYLLDDGLCIHAMWMVSRQRVEHIVSILIRLAQRLLCIILVRRQFVDGKVGFL